jgi:hypothetical protein
LTVLYQEEVSGIDTWILLCHINTCEVEKAFTDISFHGHMRKMVFSSEKQMNGETYAVVKDYVPYKIEIVYRSNNAGVRYC